MIASNRMLRWLCWSLVVAAIVAAVCQLLLSLNLWAGGPSQPDPNADLVTKLLVFRGNDQEIWPVVFIEGLASIAAFVLVALIGVALRPWAMGSSRRDAMATMFVIAAVVGVIAQAVMIGTAQAATRGYCDCGFKTEEVIAQDYSLTIGFIVQSWLSNAAFVIVAIAVGLAGRLVTVSPLWRYLSFAIALIAIVTVALRILATFVFIESIDIFNWTDIVTGLTIGILVPIWAVVLARGVRVPDTGQEMSLAEAR